MIKKIKLWTQLMQGKIVAQTFFDCLSLNELEMFIYFIPNAEKERLFKAFKQIANLKL